MLQAAIENEVAEYIDTNKSLTSDAGKRLVVRNGKKPRREIVTGAGPLEIEQPRINDRREGEKFTSAILPPYMR